MTFERRDLLGMLALVPFAKGLPACAQTFPGQSVRFIVPIAAGGGGDIATRALAAKLQQLWGYTVLVENRAGATGAIGLEAAKLARPDGLTVALCTGSHAALQTMQKRPYDLLNDFAAVTQMTSAPYVLVVNPSFPANSVEDVVKVSKQRPNGLTYGSAGQGSLQHLAGAMLAAMTGANLVHVPYKGGAPANADLLAGQIDMVFSTPQEAMPHLRSARLKALATTSEQRMKALPDLPAIRESNLSDYAVTQWYGLVTPAKTPADIVATLNKDIVASLQSPEMLELFARDGIDVVVSTPSAFKAFIVDEIERYRRLSKLTKLTLD